MNVKYTYIYVCGFIFVFYAVFSYFLVATLIINNGLHQLRDILYERRIHFTYTYVGLFLFFMLFFHTSW